MTRGITKMVNIIYFQEKRNIEIVVNNLKLKKLRLVGLSILHYRVKPKLKVEELLITTTHVKVYGQQVKI